MRQAASASRGPSLNNQAPHTAQFTVLAMESAGAHADRGRCAQGPRETDQANGKRREGTDLDGCTKPWRRVVLRGGSHLQSFPRGGWCGRAAGDYQGGLLTSTGVCLTPDSLARPLMAPALALQRVGSKALYSGQRQ